MTDVLTITTTNNFVTTDTTTVVVDAGYSLPGGGAISTNGGSVSGTLVLGGSPPLQIPAGAAAGEVLLSDSSGNAAWGSVSSSTLPTMPVSKGGTGETTASAALSNLGAFPAAGGTITGPVTMDEILTVNGNVTASSVATVFPSGDATGVTDTANILNAINANSSGASVNCSAGIFYVNSPLINSGSNPMIIRGVKGGTQSGSGTGDNLGTVIKPVSGWTTSLPVSGVFTVTYEAAPNGSTVINLACDIRDLFIDGSGGAAGLDGISVYGAMNGIQIRGVGVYKATGNGIASYANTGGYQSDGQLLQDVICENCTGKGVYGTFTDATLINVHAQSCTGDGINITGSNSRLIGCRADINANGFVVDPASSGTAFDACQLIGCSTQGNNENGLWSQNSNSVGNASRDFVEVVGCNFQGDGGNGGSGGAGYAGILISGKNTMLVTGSSVTVATDVVTGGCPEYAFATAVQGSGNTPPQLLQINSGLYNGLNSFIYDGAGLGSGINVSPQVRTHTGGVYTGTSSYAQAAPTTILPNAPTGTTSTTLVLMGMGAASSSPWLYTPTNSGITQIQVAGLVATATSNAVVTFGGRYGALCGPAVGTTVASGSNGGEVSAIASWSSPSAGVLDVATTTGYPTSGTLWVTASGSTVGQITYTGISGNSFTGCAYVQGSATGTVATGGIVTGAPQNGSVATSVGTRFGANGDWSTRGFAATNQIPFTIPVVLSLSAGTEYWFDMVLDTASGSDEASFADLILTAIELR